MKRLVRDRLRIVSEKERVMRRARARAPSIDRAYHVRHDSASPNLRAAFVRSGEILRV